jgi:IS30 family transposase
MSALWWSQRVDATLCLRRKIECMQYLPKRTDLSVYSQAHLNKVVRQLNERPRKTLAFEIPAERFNASVASTR